MSSQSKKERHRLKRQEKQRQRRRDASLSPSQLMQRRTSPLEVYLNPNWRENCQASIMVLREVPGRGHAMAAFLVDFGVPGLKDAWGKLDITPDEFHEMIDKMDDEHGMERVEPEEALRLIAGGIRFAHQNGFRLPRNYQRWLTVLGEIGDWKDADISDFDMEFAGSLQDLRARLIGCTVEAFLQRTDIQFVINNTAPSLRSDEQNDWEDQFQKIDERAIDTVRQWCFANNEAPHPQLPQAITLFFGAIEESSDDENTDPDDVTELMARSLELMPAEQKEGVAQAMEQFERFALSFPSAEAMVAAMTGEE